MFTLLDNPEAVEDMKGIWRRYLDVCKRQDMIPLCAGIDYRASPDWGAKLGLTPDGLADMQLRAIRFLQDLIGEYDFDLAYVVGAVGPRGDAYGTGGTITAEEARAYHRVQLSTLKEAGADLGWAMTFNNIPEAIGVAQAGADVSIPVAISLTLTSEHRLRSGPTLREAIEAIDDDVGDLVAFYSVNCSHPLEIEPAFDGGDWMQRIRAIRPNASAMEKIALCKIGHLEDGDPEELGGQLADVAARNRAKSSPAWYDERVSGVAETMRNPLPKAAFS